MKLVVVLVAGLGLGSLAARGDRLEGQYRGPTDRPALVRETEDESIERSKAAPPGQEAPDGSRAPAGEQPADPGAQPAPPPNEAPGSHGGKYYGPSGDTPPDGEGSGGSGYRAPACGDPGGPPPESSEPEEGDGSGRGEAPAGSSGGPSGGTGSGFGAGLNRPGGAGNKAKTDATEAFKLWSFYWEHNRERLLHDLLEARNSRSSMAPWGSSWVLGRGPKSERRIHPVTRGMIAEDVLPVLRRRREDENALIRDAAVVALGKVGGERVVPLLADSALRDEDADVREDATLALGLTRRTEALPTLLHVLRGTGIPGGKANINQRCFAAFALGLLGKPDAVSVMSDELREAVRHGKDEQLPASIALGLGLLGEEGSVEDLGAYLRLPQAGKTVKAHVASALGKLGRPDASRELRRAWNKAEPVVRGSIALALGSYAEAPVVAFLEDEGLRDPEGQNQNFAAISLARIGTELGVDDGMRNRVLDDLHERATKPRKNTTLSQYAALGLAMLGEDGVTGELRELAASRGQKHEVRSAMAMALGILGDRSSMDRLRELLASRGENPKLRSYAAMALAFLGDERESSFLQDQYRRAEGDRDVQRGCVLALGIVGDARDTGFLVEEVLTRADEATVRGAAAIALGMMREASAIPRLAQLAESQSRDVSVEDKAYAVAALGYLADKDPYPALSRVFANCNHRHEYPQLAELMRIL